MASALDSWHHCIVPKRKEKPRDFFAVARRVVEQAIGEQMDARARGEGLGRRVDVDGNGRRHKTVRDLLRWRQGEAFGLQLHVRCCEPHRWPPADRKSTRLNS